MRSKGRHTQAGQLRTPSGWWVLLDQRGVALRRFMHASTRSDEWHHSLHNNWWYVWSHAMQWRNLARRSAALAL